MDFETKQEFEKIHNEIKKLMNKLEEIQGEVIGFGSGNLKPNKWW